MNMKNYKIQSILGIENADLSLFYLQIYLPDVFELLSVVLRFVTLWLRSVTGKNLLRNKPLLAPWVADYLDGGNPPELIAHARDPRNRIAGA